MALGVPLLGKGHLFSLKGCQVKKLSGVFVDNQG